MMDLLPNDGRIYVITCPHTLQRYVGCSDETAKELARLFYELATDNETLKMVKSAHDRKDDPAAYSAKYAAFVRKPTPYRRFLDVLYSFDVLANIGNYAIKLRRYERPLYPVEEKDPHKYTAYFRTVRHDRALLPVHIADVLRAFADYAEIPFLRVLMTRISGFYNDPKLDCEICKRKYRTN